MEYLATEMAKKLDISRSYLYYLKDTCGVTVKATEQGRYIWDDEVFEYLRDYIKKNGPEEKRAEPTTEYKTFTIKNRRYLGNKYKLIPFIKKWFLKNAEI